MLGIFVATNKGRVEYGYTNSNLILCLKQFLFRIGKSLFVQMVDGVNNTIDLGELASVSDNAVFEPVFA